MKLFANRRVVLLIGVLTASMLASVSLAQNYGPPQIVVAPSNFKGVHGLAVDKQGRLLAGSVVGMSISQVDVKTGKATILIDAPQGQADDIAIGPKGEMAWTSFLQGVLRIRDNGTVQRRKMAHSQACPQVTVPRGDRSPYVRTTHLAIKLRSLCGLSFYEAPRRGLSSKALD